MIRINTDNLAETGREHGLNKGELARGFRSLSRVISNLKKRGQGFHDLPEDKKNARKIIDFAAKNRDRFEYFVLLGIGGSALGPSCLQHALKGLYEKKQLFVLDNIDPELVTGLEDKLDVKKTLFIVITKSGTTPETLAQYHYFREKIRKAGLEEKKHFVFVTDPAKGHLRETANRSGITAFDIPENVGGRFSVLSSVGLVPAALIGLDIKKLLAGAAEMAKACFNANAKNPAYLLALIQFLLFQKGKNITVLFPYFERLTKFADWYRQLLAESIGKKFNNRGRAVYAGITPVMAVGATDQHSQLQLYAEGPNDKLYIFLHVKKPRQDAKIPTLYKKMSFARLLELEMKGTIASLTENGRPSILIETDSLDEKTLGGLFMLFEFATAYLGELMEINAFDQPGVELSKKITRGLCQKTEL